MLLKIIALVDDDAIFRFLEQKVLEFSGYQGEFLHFADGEKAATFLESHIDSPDTLPDMVLLDLNMPMADGWFFLERLRNLQYNLAKAPMVYILSSSIDPEDIARSRTYEQVSDYLMKPLTIEKASELLEAVLVPKENGRR